MTENNDFFEVEQQPEADEKFYQRADEFIVVANQFADPSQMSHLSAKQGEVSASFMYANARYSVWNAACAYENVNGFKTDRQVILDYYMEQFQMMLESNLDEYEENFTTYFPESDDEDNAQPSFS